jgi:selenocysteine-specific elongation factor
VAETGLRPEAIDAHLREPLAQGKVLKIGGRFIDAVAIAGLKQLLPTAVANFHQQNPLAPGISKETLREQLGVNLNTEIFAAVLDILVREKKLEVDGEFVRAAGRAKVAMKDEEVESQHAIEAAFSSAGLKVPALKDVLAGLKVDKARAQKIITLLLRDKILVKISDELVFHHHTLLDLRKRMASEKAKSPKLDVARFKGLTGVSRKYAIPLLEYLDREHVTRRVGDERIIL